MINYGEELLGEGLKFIFLNRSRGLKLTLLKNHRPSFLQGLELDFYIPELKLAFEFQGKQHYDVVPDLKWSNTNSFLKRIIYDIQKDILCQKKRIIIVRINALELSISAIKKRVGLSITGKPNLSRKHKLAMFIMTNYNKGLFLNKKAVVKYHDKVKKYREIPYNLHGKSLMPSYFYSERFKSIFKKIKKEFVNRKKVNFDTSLLKDGISIKNILDYPLDKNNFL